jgi:hypothetical protein
MTFYERNDHDNDFLLAKGISYQLSVVRYWEYY